MIHEDAWVFKFLKRLDRIMFYVLPALTLVLTLSVVYASVAGINSGADKLEAKSKVLIAAMRGADLKAVKNIYENISHSNKVQFFGSLKSYDKNAPLSQVLEDIRSDLFLNGSMVGQAEVDFELSEMITKVDSLIKDLEEADPYEGLTPQQKRSFDTIKLKSPEQYELISNELKDISADLRSKNQLVEQYLASSNLSLLLSIAALVLTVAFFLLQLFWAYRERKFKESVDQ